MLFSVCCPLISCGLWMWCTSPQRDEETEFMLVATSTPAKDSDRRANSPDDIMASPGATWQHKLRNYVNTPIFEARRKLLVTSTRAPAPPKEE